MKRSEYEHVRFEKRAAGEPIFEDDIEVEEDEIDKVASPLVRYKEQLILAAKSYAGCRMESGDD